MDEQLYDMLERAEENEILTIITMSVYYLTQNYDYTYNKALNIVKKGCKEIERIKKGKRYE